MACVQAMYDDNASNTLDVEELTHFLGQRARSDVALVRWQLGVRLMVVTVIERCLHADMDVAADLNLPSSEQAISDIMVRAPWGTLSLTRSVYDMFYLATTYLSSLSRQHFL